jgi:hypothetical protein
MANSEIHSCELPTSDRLLSVHNELLVAALSKLEKADKGKDEAPVSYIDALMGVANAYCLNKKLNEANQYFEDAVAFFTKSKISPTA